MEIKTSKLSTEGDEIKQRRKLSSALPIVRSQESPNSNSIYISNGSLPMVSEHLNHSRLFKQQSVLFDFYKKSFIKGTLYEKKLKTILEDPLTPLSPTKIVKTEHLSLYIYTESPTYIYNVAHLFWALVVIECKQVPKNSNLHTSFSSINSNESLTNSFDSCPNMNNSFPLDFLFLIEKSNDLQKNELAKSTIKLILEQLSEKNRVAVISFQDEVVCSFELNFLTQENNTKILQLLSDENIFLLNPNQSTSNLKLEEALDFVANLIKPSNEIRLPNVMLFSDALGYGDLKKQVLDRIEKKFYGFPIFTFGLGSGHDSIFLQNVAFLSASGAYFPVTSADPNQISNLFETYFHQRSLVHDLNLYFRANDGCRIAAFHTDQIYKEIKSKKDFDSKVGFLSTKGWRSFLVQLSIRDTPQEVKHQKLLNLSIDYKNAMTGQTYSTEAKLSISRTQYFHIWRRAPEFQIHTMFNLVIDAIRGAAGSSRGLAREMFQDCLQLLKENSKNVDFINLLKLAFTHWIYRIYPDVVSRTDSINFKSPAIEKERHISISNVGISLTESDLRWIKKFISIMEKNGFPSNPAKRKFEQFDQIYKLSKEFETVAVEFAKKIVEEIMLPDTQKTIKPINFFNMTIGKTYFKDGIFFKLSSDISKFFKFEDDEAALKMISHEMKGLRAILGTGVNIFIPLTIEINIYGHRLLAFSALPTSHSSFLYGSHDGGKTVVNKNSDFHTLMKKVGEILKLKEHKCATQLIVGPTDIQGYRGSNNYRATDKSFVFNLGRLFPSEDPTNKRYLFIPIEGSLREISFEEKETLIDSNPSQINLDFGVLYYSRVGLINVRASKLAKQEIHGDAIFMRTHSKIHLYQLLRPEIISEYGPLCSDAFTQFQENDPDRHFHNDEATSVTRTLCETVIAEFAQSLIDHFRLDFYSLITGLHKKGINIRYLGIVRRFIPSTYRHIRNFLLTEMVCRSIRDIIRSKMRKLQKNSPEPIKERRYKQLVVKYYNTILGNGEKSHKYWESILKVHVQVKFPLALSESELDIKYNLRDNLLMFPIFQRSSNLLGIKFTRAIQTKLFKQSPDIFSMDLRLPLFSENYIESFDVTTRYLVDDRDIRKAVRQYYSLEKDGAEYKQFINELDHSFSQALDVMIDLRVNEAIKSILETNSRETIFSYFKVANSLSKLGNTSLALEYAMEGFYFGTEVFGSWSEETLIGLVTLGDIHEKTIHEKTKLTRTAKENYKQALELLQKLHGAHPLTGQLFLKLSYLSYCEGKEDEMQENIKESYKYYCKLYNESLVGVMVIPFQAFQINFPSFSDHMEDFYQKQVLGEFYDRINQDKYVEQSYTLLWPREIFFCATEAKENFLRSLRDNKLENVIPLFEKMSYSDILNIKTRKQVQDLGINQMGTALKIEDLIKNLQKAIPPSLN